MAGKISIIGQIAEVEREIRMREQVYPKQVREGRMRDTEATMLLDRMRAVLATLHFCRENEADIRAYIAARKEGRS